MLLSGQHRAGQNREERYGVYFPVMQVQEGGERGQDL